MRFYRWPGILGLVAFGLTIIQGWDPAVRAPFAYAGGGLLNGAIVYAVSSVVLVAWRKLRGRPLSDPPR